MNTIFQDLEHECNPQNGEVLSDRQRVFAMLDELRQIKPPFMCQFIGSNGFNLTVGIDYDYGCVQHSANDGTPPYLMAVAAVNTGLHHDEMEFVVGGTATPIDGRYCLSFSLVKEITAEFVESGKKSDNVIWEEF